MSLHQSSKHIKLRHLDTWEIIIKFACLSLVGKIMRTSIENNHYDKREKQEAFDNELKWSGLNY